MYIHRATLRRPAAEARPGPLAIARPGGRRSTARAPRAQRAALTAGRLARALFRGRAAAVAGRRIALQVWRADVLPSKAALPVQLRPVRRRSLLLLPGRIDGARASWPNRCCRLRLKLAMAGLESGGLPSRLSPTHSLYVNNILLASLVQVDMKERGAVEDALVRVDGAQAVEDQAAEATRELALLDEP